MKQKIVAFLRGAMEHPKTTASGIAGLIGVGYGAYRDPSMLAKPETWVLVLVSAGLVFGADSKEKAEPPVNLDRIAPAGK